MPKLVDVSMLSEAEVKALNKQIKTAADAAERFHGSPNDELKFEDMHCNGVCEEENYFGNSYPAAYDRFSFP